MTIEVFRSELKKRGLDDEQIRNCEDAAMIMVELQECEPNRAYTAVFDAIVQTLAELRKSFIDDHLAQVEREIIDGIGNKEPRGILP